MQSFSRDPVTDRSLKHSLKDAGAFAVMTGTGETYLSAYALFLQATTPQIGILASLPPLLASAAQLLSAWLGRITGHRKQIILAGASLQAFAWLPVFLLPLLFPEHAMTLLIIAVIVYHSGGHLATPQWSSLMGDIVPRRRRGRFFALRTQLITALTFASLIGGGTLLHLTTQQGNTLAGFALLFLVAIVARLVSVYHLGKMHDPPGHVAALELPFTRNWAERLRHSNAVRFSVFFACMQLAVAISSPYFTVFMLRDLQYSYLEFTANTGMAILVQFLTLAQWGRISDVFGNRRILGVTCLVIPALPVLWILSTNFWYLLFLQALSGFAWAGFSLSASNFVYDLIAPQRRATYLAIHNVLAGVGLFIGALLGGYLALVIPVEFSVAGWSVNWVSPLCGVFLLSTLARLAVVMALLPRLREVRSVRPISLGGVVFRVTRVNALAGLVFDIVGSRQRKDERDEQ